MFVALVVVVLVAAASVRTKPDPASFPPFLAAAAPTTTSSSSTPASTTGPSRWLPRGFRRVLAGVASGRFATPRTPDFKLHDWLFCLFATTSDGRAFIGAFGTWLPVPPALLAAATAATSNPSRSSGGSGGDIPLVAVHSGGGDAADNGEDGEPEALADAARDAAVRLKGARDFAAAARTFGRAGSLYSSAATAAQPALVLQAGKCFEDAAGCYSVAGLLRESRAARVRAAEAFSRSDRTASRAGRAFETVADERDLSVRSKIADILAKQGLFDEAIQVFEACADECEDDKALRFSVKTHVFGALFCVLAQRDWGTRLASSLDAALARHPICVDYSEVRFFRELALAWATADTARFDAAADRFRAIAGSSGLPDWHAAAVAAARGRFGGSGDSGESLC
ncbi:hypothetical protein HK405_007003 [Cladochytrium tenue]|nr:hypothetical protein HK405_007003 [Cladochytrium tenue]